MPMPVTMADFRKSFFLFLRDRQLLDQFYLDEQWATAHVPLSHDSSQSSQEGKATRQIGQSISNAARYAYSRGRYTFFSRKQQSEFLSGLEACAQNGFMRHQSVVCTIMRRC